MNPHSTTPDAVNVILTPMEADMLSQWLDKLVEQYRPEGDGASLAIFQEQLADAQVIAQWLGENVQMEMPRSDVLQLCRILRHGMPSLPDDATAARILHRFTQQAEQAYI